MKYNRVREKLKSETDSSVAQAAEGGALTMGDEEGEKPKKTKKAPTKKGAAKKRKMNDDEDEAENAKVKTEEGDEVSTSWDHSNAFTDSCEDRLISRPA